MALGRRWEGSGRWVRPPASQAFGSCLGQGEEDKGMDQGHAWADGVRKRRRVGEMVGWLG